MGPIKTTTLQGPSEKINLWDFDTVNGREKLLLYTKFVLFVDGKLYYFTLSYLQQLSRWNDLKCFVKLNDSLLVLFTPHVGEFNWLIVRHTAPKHVGNHQHSSLIHPDPLHQEGLMSESLRLINFYYSDFVLHSSLVWHVAATCRRGVNLWPNCHLSWNSVNALPWFCRPRSGNHLPVPCISTPPWFLHPSPPPPFSRYYPTAPAVRSKARAHTERSGCWRAERRGGEREEGKRTLFAATSGCNKDHQVKRSISVRSAVKVEERNTERQFSTAGRRHAKEERFP